MSVPNPVTLAGKKTLAEHKEYVEQLARISFFFARYLKAKMPDQAVGELLRDHAPLFFHGLNYRDYLTKWDNPDCQWIMRRANELGHYALPEFEERMYAEIKNLAMERAERFYPESVGVGAPPDYNAGSLKYDAPLKVLPPNQCNFHIANAIAPQSIFDDPAYLPRCFRELMDKSAKQYGYDTLRTVTWLNDNPRWLKLFPEEWLANLSPRTDEVGWTFGNWGQVVSGRGTFNKKAGQFVRTTGTLKYKARYSRCSFAALRKHLDSLFPP